MTDNNLNRNNSLCSVCHTEHAPDSRCRATAAKPAGPLLAQAESLFESYLAARLARARRSLTEAKVALLREPRNRDKREALLRAEAETQKLETQLLEQARRAAEAREQASARTGDTASTNSISSQPTPDFRALQAAKADLTLGSAAGANPPGPSDRNCPHCSNRVPGDSEFCGCGYRFTPAVTTETFLTEEELIALRVSKARE